uniref:papilin-like n=1 Tax=Myxine glutinosa TaxID=7769 RepID=UPI00358DE4C2
MQEQRCSSIPAILLSRTLDEVRGAGGGDKDNGHKFEKQVSLESIPAVCAQPVEVGPCRAALRRWYFDPETGNCSLFVYGGCQGNKNNFGSHEGCHTVCSPSDHASSTFNNSMSKFLIVHALGVVLAGLAATVAALLLFMWLRRLDSNRVQRTSIFTVRPQPQPRSDDTASLIPNMVFWCSSIPAILLSRTLDEVRGAGGGDKDNGHKFEKQVSLESIPAVCAQPVEVGPCRAALRRWYFDPETGNCSLFVYGGCQGNKNNFGSHEGCHTVCSPSDHASSTLNNSMSKFLIVHALGVVLAGLAATVAALLLFMWLRRLDSNRVQRTSIFTVRPQPQPRSDDTASLIPNMVFSPDYLLMASSHERSDTSFPLSLLCLASPFHSFVLSALSHNEQRCSSIPAILLSRTLDEVRRVGGGDKDNGHKFEKQVSLESIPAVCAQPVEVGPCRAALRRWYFDPETGNCSLFVYGGCQGNKNNFGSHEGCHTVCSPSDHASSTLNNSMSKFLIVHALGVVLAATVAALLLFMWLCRLDSNRVQRTSIFTVRPQPQPRSDDTASLIPNMVF